MARNGWTPERRARQAAAIRRWKPWRKAGVKTAAGAAVSRWNALKHGARSAAVRRLSKLLAAIEREVVQISNEPEKPI